MKIIIVFAFLAITVVESAFCQGTFIFRNHHPLGVDAPVFDAEGNRLMGTSYVAILYGGPTPDAMRIARAGAADMPPESFTAVINNQPGYFAAPGFVISDTDSTGLAWLQVRAWDIRLGSTYDDVVRLGLGGYGASQLFQARGGDSVATGRPPQPLIGLESFSLVPEPSTWALLAIGAGVLFWKCSRQARDETATAQRKLKSLFVNAVVLTMLSIDWASAQATFFFRNFYAGEVDAPVFDAAGNRLFGDNYVAVLYGGPTPDSLVLANAGVGSMSPVPFTATFGGQAGYFSRAGQLHLNNVLQLGYAWLQVRVWDTRLGPTYDDVVRLGLGGYGQSALFYTYGGELIVPGIPPQPLRGLESFSLVPEPGTWGLLAIGAGVLLWDCRRRQSS